MNLRERIEFVIKIVEEFGKLDDELLQLAHKNNSWFDKNSVFNFSRFLDPPGEPKIDEKSIKIDVGAYFFGDLHVSLIFRRFFVIFRVFCKAKTFVF